MSKGERYKQLQHLLGRSKFYTQYLQNKIAVAASPPAPKKIKKEVVKIWQNRFITALFFVIIYFSLFLENQTSSISLNNEIGHFNNM